MEGRALFEDGDLKRPDDAVLQILQSSSLWDLILFKAMNDLSGNEGLINRLLSVIDIIHISLGSLLHECLEEVGEEENVVVLHPDLAKILGFSTETTQMKLRPHIPSKYSSLFQNLRLIEGDSKAKVEHKVKRKRSSAESFTADSSLSESPLECPKCHKAFSSKNNVHRHMKNCHDKETDEKAKVNYPDFVCVFCKTSYSTFLSFRNHVNVTCSKKPTDLEGHLCDKCKVFIFSPPGTKHPCEPYFKCDKCTFKCCNESHFRQHYRLVHLHVGINYCCEVCGKMFESKSHLANHLVVHTKERSFLCTECGKGFGRKSVLDVHMSVHFSKNVPCNICGKIFAHSNLVRKHIATQHPKDGVLTRESCPHCSSTFRSKFYLIKHIKHKHARLN